MKFANYLFFTLLSLLDIIAGVVILFQIDSFTKIIGALLLLKALLSMTSSAAATRPLDFLGFIDLIAAIVIIFSLDFLKLFGFIPLTKGLYFVLLVLLK